jgi:hypothetical protein
LNPDVEPGLSEPPRDRLDPRRVLRRRQPGGHQDGPAAPGGGQGRHQSDGPRSQNGDVERPARAQGGSTGWKRGSFGITSNLTRKPAAATASAAPSSPPAPTIAIRAVLMSIRPDGRPRV